MTFEEIDRYLTNMSAELRMNMLGIASLRRGMEGVPEGRIADLIKHVTRDIENLGEIKTALEQMLEWENEHGPMLTRKRKRTEEETSGTHES